MKKDVNLKDELMKITDYDYPVKEGKLMRIND